MKEFAKVVASHLSPAMRGIGLGYDPVPREYRGTFIESDLGAFIADTEALYLGWCCVQGLITERTLQSTETHHHRRNEWHAGWSREREKHPA
jgi:hypothetical protein